MKILVTGSNGFVGKNLVESLNNIKHGYDHIHPINGLKHPDDLTIIGYDRTNTFSAKTQVFNEITKTTSHFCGISLRVFAVIRLKVCSPDSPPCLTKCCMRSWRSAAWGCHAVLPERLTKHGVRASGSTSSRHPTPLFETREKAPPQMPQMIV